MKETFENNPCGRAEQLVGYLYGEATPGERVGFERHLSACAACRDELAAYGFVRESVSDWRAELLRGAPAVPLAGVLPPPAAPYGDTFEPRRTAWDALRELFSLTPAWLRAASAAAALAVCALAALAVLNAEVRREGGGFAFSTGVWKSPAPTPVAPTAAPPAAPDSPAELSRVSAERDAALRELEDTRAQLETSRAANIEAAYRTADETGALTNASADDGAPRSSDPSRARRQNNASPARTTSAGRKGRAARDQDNLPRLLDLLGDAN